MKKQHIVALLMGLLMTVGVQAQLPKPVTDDQFGIPAQTSEWWEKYYQALAAQEARGGQPPADDDGEESSVNFYTGKPYDAEIGGYVFKYRNYSPETQRWMTADPSGFPDGANNYGYVSRPNKAFDKLGLYSDEDARSDMTMLTPIIAGWWLLGYNYSVQFANHSLNKGGDRTATSDEIDCLRYDGAFSDVFNKDYFAQFTNSPSFDGSKVVEYSYDLHYSYGKVGFHYTGNVIWINGRWSTVVTFTFADTYDFDPNSGNAFIQAFYRLQTFGYASIFVNNGTFVMTYWE